MITTFSGRNLELKEFEYKGQELLIQWQPYFKDAPHGKYWVLVNKQGLLLMSNVPVEHSSNQEILDKAFGDVLIVGLGINLINDKVLELDCVNSVTTLEIDEDVIKNVPTKTTVFKGDATVLHEELRGKFDVIYFDGFCRFERHILEQYKKNKHSLLLTWNIKYNGA